MSADRLIYPPSQNPSKFGPFVILNPADRIHVISASVATLLALASLSAAGWAWCSRDPRWIYPVLALWVLGPPVWFWVDYFVIYRRYGDPEAFDSFKHGQQVSLAVWAAIALLLTVLANADRFKSVKQQPASVESASTCGIARALWAQKLYW